MAAVSRILLHLLWAGVLCLTFTACTVTETVKDVLGSIKDILSSTTPGVWFTEDGLLKADQKVNAFVAINFENLKQDMARGRGEYLSSLGELMGVSRGRQEAFYSFAQSRYPLINNSQSGPSDLVAVLTIDR
jgi:hypothetical protein